VSKYRRGFVLSSGGRSPTAVQHSGFGHTLFVRNDMTCSKFPTLSIRFYVVPWRSRLSESESRCGTGGRSALRNSATCCKGFLSNQLVDESATNAKVCKLFRVGGGEKQSESGNILWSGWARFVSSVSAGDICYSNPHQHMPILVGPICGHDWQSMADSL
jgi:hypothetical protein